MLRKANKLMISSFIVFLTFIATVSASVNSLWFFYEPDIPKNLKSKE
ncbi:cyclic lactone autoinducer peptide [Caloranaerobacter ferrireducens]|nr:cyclic lactone autoinducer peptide [Caloranaerobacter ferrireducens]